MKKMDSSWQAPGFRPEDIKHGDMPGDLIHIGESHISRARSLFPSILKFLKESGKERIVLSVFGGSGVGKSEIGSILGHYCSCEGYPAYILSGDNYPRRIPVQNDAERLNTYRSAGLAALAAFKGFRDEWDEEIHAFWENGRDADPERGINHEGFRIYQKAGRAALMAYLSSEREIDFSMVNSIIRRFKEGENLIPLKRMGRTPDAIHLENVNFKGIKVLLIEWTHGNNPALEGVDYPVFLYCSPEETLVYRRYRNRDEGVGNPFTNLVMKIEQTALNRYAEKAALIICNNGEILRKDEFLKLCSNVD